MGKNGALRCAQSKATTTSLGDLPVTDEAAGRVRAEVHLELSKHGPLSVVDLAGRCRQDVDVVEGHLADLAAAGYVDVTDGQWVTLSLVARYHLRAAVTAAA